MPLPPYLTLKTGDITLEACDAIVNAANRHLAGGGGVDGAIHRAAGEAELKAACEALGGCPTGQAKATPAFALKAKHIIHAVGPRYKSGFDNAKALASAYTASLQLAAELGCQSIAFPALSTGVYGYPVQEAVAVSKAAIEAFQAGPQALKEVRLVYFKDEHRRLAEKAWA
jgi:O-acetyl-ADP-ribose deacetylase (regulator of RNase III)